tara:strand:- start:325 stop:1101 length:777 start_codon:yes stop_codon:yes gene_type:complete
MAFTSGMIKGGLKLADVVATATGRQLNRLGSKLGMDKDMLKNMNENQIKSAIMDEGQQYIRNMRKNQNRRTGAAFYGGLGVAGTTYGVADFVRDMLGIGQTAKDSSFSKEELSKLRQKQKEKESDKPKATPTKKPKEKIKKLVEESKKRNVKSTKTPTKKEGVQFDFETIPKGKTKKGNIGLLASKKDLKPVPVGKKGKGLSMLDKSVRNNMGFMYGGGMPKKPRMSNTDYRKASKGMLIISIDMKKKKPKTKKNKRG